MIRPHDTESQENWENRAENKVFEQVKPKKNVFWSNFTSNQKHIFDHSASKDYLKNKQQQQQKLIINLMCPDDLFLSFPVWTQYFF